MIGKDVCIINKNVREAIQLSIQRENDKSWTKLEERTLRHRVKAKIYRDNQI